MGEFRARRHTMIDDNEQFQIPKCTYCLELIGEGHHRVAAAHDQASHLSFSGLENLVGQKRSEHFSGQSAQALHAVRRSRRRIAWSDDAGPAGIARH